MANFIYKVPTGGFVLYIPREINQIVLASIHEMNVAGGLSIHRTKVEDMSGDLFDMLDLEMANDTVVESAGKAMKTNASSVEKLFAEATDDALNLELILDSKEKVMQVLQWFNTLYSWIRRSDTAGFLIGSSQPEHDDSYNTNLPYDIDAIDSLNNEEIEKIVQQLRVDLTATLVDELSLVLMKF